MALNVITTEHPNHTDAATLAAQNTGKAELLAVLPADTSLNDQARLFLKTQKYVQQNTGAGDNSRKAISTNAVSRTVFDGTPCKRRRAAS